MPRRRVRLSVLRRYRRDAGGGEWRNREVMIGNDDVKVQIEIVPVALLVIPVAISHRHE